MNDSTIYSDETLDLIADALSNALQPFTKALEIFNISMRNIIEILAKVANRIREFSEYLKGIIAANKSNENVNLFNNYTEVINPFMFCGESVKERSPPKRSIKEKAEIWFIYFNVKYSKIAFSFINLIIVNELYASGRELFRFAFGF